MQRISNHKILQKIFNALCKSSVKKVFKVLLFSLHFQIFFNWLSHFISKTQLVKVWGKYKVFVP